MHVNAFIPAGTFGSGTSRDRHDDFTMRELENTPDGRAFVWYYGARLEVEPDASVDPKLGGLPAYRVIGRLGAGSRWFIVDVYADVAMQYRVAAETVEADAADSAIHGVAEQYPKARTFRCLEIREDIAKRLRRNK